MPHKILALAPPWRMVVSSQRVWGEVREWWQGDEGWARDPDTVTRILLCQSCGASDTPLHLHLYVDHERTEPLRRMRVCAACCTHLGPLGCQRPIPPPPMPIRQRMWRLLTLTLGDLVGIPEERRGWQEVHLISIIGGVAVALIGLWLVMH